MACDCVTNALREHPDCYDHTNECVADRVEAAEAKGYAKALEEALKCFDPLIREGDAERLYEVTYRRIQALKEKVKP